jgi:ADP-ribosylglycohydrolase
MQLIDEGAHPKQAAREVHLQLDGLTAGCNGAHRAPVLATFRGLEDDKLDDAARRLTACTHQHELAVDTAVGDGLDARIKQSIAEARHEPAGTGGYSPETLQSALYFALTRETFMAAVEDALDFAGPPNYCPVLVGAIAGARWGVESIDHRYLDHCRDRARILSLARSIESQ